MTSAIKAQVEDDPGRLVDLVRVDVAAPREQKSVADSRDEEDLEDQVGVGDQRSQAEEAARAFEARDPDAGDPGERAAHHDGGGDDRRALVAGAPWLLSDALDYAIGAQPGDLVRRSARARSRRTSSVCWPSTGGASRCSSGVPEKRIGLATSGSLPATGCSSSIFTPRALTCGSSNTWATSLIGPFGDARGLEQVDPLVRAASSRRSPAGRRVSSARFSTRLPFDAKRGSSRELGAAARPRRTCGTGCRCRRRGSRCRPAS